MSNKNSLRFLVVLLFAAFASASLVLVDAGAFGQNANSSTTGDDSAQNANENMMAKPRPRRGRRGRRGRRSAPAAADANANANTTAEPSMTPNPSGGGGQSEDVSAERADLSGTYTGRLVMTGGHEMSGEATLTITSNTFQLAGEGMNHGGRVYAVTTRGYTGAAFYFTDLTDPTTNTPVVANVRARKSGDRLALIPVPGTKTRMTFRTGGGGTGGGRHGRRGRRAAATTDMTTTTDTNMSGGAATGTEATGTESTTPAPRRGRRGSRRARGTTNTNANTNANSNTGDNSNATPPM